MAWGEGTGWIVRTLPCKLRGTHIMYSVLELQVQKFNASTKFAFSCL